MENLENKMNNSHRKMSPYRRRSWMHDDADAIRFEEFLLRVNERNIECLQRVGNPIVRIDADIQERRL